MAGVGVTFTVDVPTEMAGLEAATGAADKTNRGPELAASSASKAAAEIIIVVRPLARRGDAFLCVFSII
jgi:hypothetical protein